MTMTYLSGRFSRGLSWMSQPYHVSSIIQRLLLILESTTETIISLYAIQALSKLKMLLFLYCLLLYSTSILKMKLCYSRTYLTGIMIYNNLKRFTIAWIDTACYSVNRLFFKSFTPSPMLKCTENVFAVQPRRKGVFDSTSQALALGDDCGPLTENEKVAAWVWSD